MTVRPYRQEDWADYLKMRSALWPGTTAMEAAGWLSRDDAVTLVILDAEDVALGFAEVGERPYADGCDSSPVAFLEGWFVQSAVRGQGLGRALVKAAEDWARARGREEFASDSLLSDTEAIAAHRAVGFEEVERAVRFRKPLF